MKNKQFINTLFPFQGGGNSFLFKPFLFCLLMLGFFSCGKEAVAPELTNFKDRIVNDRVSDNCDCELIITGITGGDPDIIWALTGDGAAIMTGRGNQLASGNNPPSPPISFEPGNTFGIIWFDAEVPDDFTITFDVRCEYQNGEITLINSHSFTLTIGEADNCEVFQNQNRTECEFGYDFDCIPREEDGDVGGS